MDTNPIEDSGFKRSVGGVNENQLEYFYAESVWLVTHYLWYGTYSNLWYDIDMVCIVPVRGQGAEKAGKIAPKFSSLEQF